MEMSPVSARMLAGILEQRTGQMLSDGRHWRLDIALDTLIRTHGFGSADAVAAAVAGGRDPALSDAVVEALLNNETSFFRDPLSFGLLIDRALPQVMAARPDRTLRIWSAGCSTGQEAYSIAMALAGIAALDDWRIDIVATDVSQAAIKQARDGEYSQFEIQRGLAVRQLVRWFDGEGDVWRARPELRARVRFHTLSVLDAPPLPARFDIILCRNVLFYFSDAVRRRAFQRLARAAAPDAFLLLGAGETAIDQTGYFTSDVDNRGLYRPVDHRAA
ncbi:CheR family methyltransferase [Sphingomonas montana]|uniref:CheR family methyltransferase n=1 Tax=Sphingomonas montana TaxID=1843236 RepID=UPI0009F8FE86|nr:protein-glutamate O-methyltransferase CheR [Sphingomonas montana]